MGLEREKVTSSKKSSLQMQKVVVEPNRQEVKEGESSY